MASSDATNMECSIVREGDSYVVHGVKWWSSGAGDPRCKIAIVMGVTPNPLKPKYECVCVSLSLLTYTCMHTCTHTGMNSTR